MNLFNRTKSASMAVLMLIFIFCMTSALAETKTVMAKGDSDLVGCVDLKDARMLAQSTADKYANDSCYGLGSGWSYSGLKFPGHMHCTPCIPRTGFKKNGFHCKVTKAIGNCVSMNKENAEEFAKFMADQERVNEQLKIKNRIKFGEIGKAQDPNASPSETAAIKDLKKQQAKENADALKKEKESKNRDPKVKPLKEQDPSPSLGASVLDGAGGTSSPNIASLLDEKAEAPLIQKRLNQEIAAFRVAAQPGCVKKLNEVNACYTNTGCNRPAGSPSAERCKSIPDYPRKFGPLLTSRPRPGDVCYIKDAACRAAEREYEASEERERAEMKAKQRHWKLQYEDLSNDCQQRTKEREAFAICQKQFDSTCNPNSFNTVDDCVDKQVRAEGPSKNDARKLMQKEWDARSKKGQSITNSILD